MSCQGKGFPSLRRDEENSVKSCIKLYRSLTLHEDETLRFGGMRC